MEIVALIIGSVFGLIALVCNILILIHAFQASVGEGFLCLCVPCYILFYMFSKFEHPQKTLIITGALAGNAVANVAFRLPGLMRPSYDPYGY